MMTKEIIIRLVMMLEKYQQLFSDEEREAIKPVSTILLKEVASLLIRESKQRQPQWLEEIVSTNRNIRENYGEILFII